MICHPLDTLRTRLQSASPGQFTGLRDCLHQTLRKEGALALYKGLAAPMAAQGVYKALLFSINAGMRHELGGRTDVGAVALSGCVAGSINAAVVTPVELVRNRLQVQYGVGGSGQYRGPVDVVRQVTAAQGVRGLFQGLGATILRDGPGMACFFLGFEGAKRVIQPTDLPSTLLAGSFAGIGFWLWALPLDTVKTVAQMRESDGKTVARVAGELMREGGLSRFFRGWQAAFVRGIPGASVTISVHSFAMQWLAKQP